MWMRRKHPGKPRADADQRLDAAHAARAEAGEALRRSAAVAARSAELTQVNSIAAAIAASLKPRPGGNNHAP